MYLLLVDSELFTSADLQEMLKHAPDGSDIVNTYSAETLLRVAGKISPDIIIVDFDLIDEEADDIFKKLRTISEKAHILALIDSDNYDKLFEAIDHAGVDDYIVKPIRKEELIARVQIASRRKPRPAAEYVVPADIMLEEEHAAPKVEEEPSEKELSPLKEDLEEVAGFSFDDDESAGEEPLVKGEEEQDDDPFSTGLLEEPETEITENQDFSTEEEFKIYDDPEMADMFEPDEPQVENKTGQQDDPFGLSAAEEGSDKLGDIKAMSETEYSFDDLETADEFQPKTVEEPTDKLQEDKQDFDFFDDFPEEEALPLPGEDKVTGESMENLFDEDEFAAEPLISAPEKDEMTKEPDFGKDETLKGFEETTSDEEDPWNFESFDEEEKKDHVPGQPNLKPAAGAQFLDEEDLFAEDEKPTAKASDVGDSESYFDDLFAEEPPKREAQTEVDEDDLFGSDSFDQQPAERKPPKPKSDLPGKTADDFLYGETAIDDDSNDESYNKAMLDEFTFDEDDDDEKPKKKVRRAPRKGSGGGFSKFLSIFGNVVFVALLLMMATLSFFLIQSRITGGVPQVAGYQMYIVLSGSMAPEFDTGSLAFVKETPPEQIVVGDIITYRSQAGSDSLTTHRVVEVQRQDGLQFITRGDANNVNDPNPVLAENVVGRVTGSIPHLGYLMNFVQTRQGLILLIFVPGVLIIVYELGKIMKYLTESRREETVH